MYCRNVVLSNTIREEDVVLPHFVSLSTPNLGTFAMHLTIKPQGYPAQNIDFLLLPR